MVIHALIIVGSAIALFLFSSYADQSNPEVQKIEQVAEEVLETEVATQIAKKKS